MTIPSLYIPRLLKKSFPVLWLLYILQGAVSEAEIANLLEIDVETARNYLRSLVGLGLARRHSRTNGFEISAQGEKIFTPPSAGIPRNAATTTTTATTTDLDPESSKAAVAAANAPSAGKSGRKGRKRSRRKGSKGKNAPRAAKARQPPDKDSPRSALYAENQAAFREEGVGMSFRVQKICEQEHVSPEFIHAQALRLRDEQRFSSSLLIYVIERNDPLPADAEEQERRRYIDNPYSEFINS